MSSTICKMQKISFDERIRAKFDRVVRGPEDMHDYQLEAEDSIYNVPFSHLFIDLGLGKTIISLSLIVRLLQAFLTEKVLVVGPLKVMTGTWPDEIGLWSHTAPYNFTLIREDDDDPRIRAARAQDRRELEERNWIRSNALFIGGDLVLPPTNETRTRHLIREQLAKSRQSIHFINKEQLVWLVNLFGAKWPYRTVFIDELSMFKDHASDGFRALAKVRRTPGLITRLHGLTATPAAETYLHLWSQLYLVDLGQRLGKNVTTYRNRYFTYNKYQRKWYLRPGAKDEILDKIKDVCFVYRAKDHLKLEEPLIVKVPVSLSKATVAKYEELSEESIVRLNDGSVIESKNAAALSGSLLQLASGSLYETQDVKDWETDDIKKVRKVHHIHDDKIEALREIVESMDGEPLLVSYNFKSSLDRLKKAFPSAKVMDREGKLRTAWNARQIPLLFIHPKSGGHGMNLQAGGHNLVFFDLVWSLELYLQLIGRLARQGQANPVVVRLLLAIGTIDWEVAKALGLKEEGQEELLRILQRLVKQYRLKRG